jgi:hypothetical protein
VGLHAQHQIENYCALVYIPQLREKMESEFQQSHSSVNALSA